MKTNDFAFKDLHVWQKSMDFVNSILTVTENINSVEKHFRLKEQLESAAASVPQNIAEGKGRNSKKEFIQFLYIARGSLYESITLLYIFSRRSWINNEELNTLEDQAKEIVRMVKGLINSLYDSQ